LLRQRELSVTGRFRALAGCIFLLAPALLAAQLPATPPVPAPRPREECPKCIEAQRKLEVAKIYLAEGRLPEARKWLEEAVTADPANNDVKGLLDRVLQQENRRNAARQESDLAEAQWQLRSGQRDKAFELARKVAESAQDPGILSRADKILTEARPENALSQLEMLARQLWSGWGFGLLVLVLFGLAVWLILLLARELYAALAGPNNWRIRSLEDKNGLGAAQLVLAAFSRLASRKPVTQPASAGLLKLEVLPLPSATGLLLEFVEFDGRAQAAEGLQLRVGGVQVGTLTRLPAGFKHWFQARLPTVTGLAFASPSGQEVTVRLTGRRRDRSVATISASARSDGVSDAARAAAESAVLKIYWWMVRPQAPEAEAEAAEQLREGFDLLRRHMEAEPAGVLEQALVKFGQVRRTLPEFWEAYLYEGVTLDLLERHDEALLRFEYVESHVTVSALRDKAVYNQAVAHMRKFQPEELRKACNLFARVAGPRPDVLREPIKVLAKGGRANAIAHYPIFWEWLLHRGRTAATDTQRLEWKRADVGEVFAWLRQVNELAKEIDGDLESIRRARDSAWDEQARRQLEWAKLNAVGNVHLNLALGFLCSPRPAEFDTVASDRQRFLEIALESFQASELLLAPGVETLSNIGTTYLYMGRGADARSYLARAIQLNPGREYAYYRTAQSWDQENHRDKVLEVLKGYGRPVRIPEFRQLFEKYQVPLPQ